MIKIFFEDTDMQEPITWEYYMAKFEIGDTLTNHVYYDRNQLGNPQKDALILAVVMDKSDKQLKVSIISYGGETNRQLIYDEIKCDEADCWVNPFWWKKFNR